MLLIIAHRSAALSVNFAPAVSLDVGSGPASVATLDINGNGKVALISANFNDDTLTVLTNNGSGGFGSNATLNVGSNPQCVAAADVNGDGKPDLISANYGDGTLTVWTNNGSGGFGFNATLDVGSGPDSSPVYVTTVDIHKNGKPDLISANSYDGTLTVLTNDGSGGFGYNATLSVGLSAGSSPNSIAVADVNGDGKLDLISANSGDNTLTVYTNDGGNGFVFSTTFFVGSVPYSVAAADVNGDGKVDLISANAGSASLTVWTNNGSGGFVLAATLPAGNLPVCVIAADVNGDNKADLIYADASTNTLTVLANNGSGGFSLSATLTVGSTPVYVVAADVNGDGWPDLISANFRDGTLSVLLNSPVLIGPPLAISLTGPKNVVVSWPSPSDGFVLQQKTNLAPATSWLNFSGTVNTSGTTNSVTISPATNNLFFRLRHP